VVVVPIRHLSLAHNQVGHCHDRDDDGVLPSCDGDVEVRSELVYSLLIAACEGIQVQTELQHRHHKKAKHHHHHDHDNVQLDYELEKGDVWVQPPP
jgi:hypothetical protein